MAEASISLRFPVQELYGDEVAGLLTSAFSRLFTFYLQTHGFTCGIDDLLLVPTAEAERADVLQRAEPAAWHASAGFVGQADADATVRAAMVISGQSAVATIPATHHAHQTRYQNRHAGLLANATWASTASYWSVVM